MKNMCMNMKNLGVLLLCSFVVASCSAASSSYSSNTKTVEISTAEQLQAIQNNLSSDYIYILTANIDLAGMEFEAIGSNKYSYFEGFFDGAGYTISNLTINKPNNNYIGLFGYSNGVIRNVILDNVSVTGTGDKYTVGGLVGVNNRNGIIENSTVSGSVNSTGTGSGVGGLVGVNGGMIARSTFSGSVNSTYTDNFVGGLVGFNDSDGTIENSTSSGSVVGNTFVGGLVGGNKGTIENSTSSGSVNSIVSSAVGGLVGENFNGTIDNSTSSGSVDGNVNVGGLVGINDSNGTISAVSGVSRLIILL